jgi:hypothetical protein
MAAQLGHQFFILGPSQTDTQLRNLVVAFARQRTSPLSFKAWFLHHQVSLAFVSQHTSKHPAWADEAANTTTATIPTAALNVNLVPRIDTSFVIRSFAKDGIAN